MCTRSSAQQSSQESVAVRSKYLQTLKHSLCTAVLNLEEQTQNAPFSNLLIMLMIRAFSSKAKSVLQTNHANPPHQALPRTRPEILSILTSKKSLLSYYSNSSNLLYEISFCICLANKRLQTYSIIRLRLILSLEELLSLL